MARNTITKQGLIAFIEANFSELQCGGCADYSKAYNGIDEYTGANVIMSTEDIQACERVLSDLLTKKHRANRFTSQLARTGLDDDEVVEIDLRAAQ